jgi:ectoine hydroxylase-related dioxygenase (phytanoyl-CoA dioxygenase family)
VRPANREDAVTEGAKAARESGGAAPDLARPHALPAACIDEFRAKGHTVVRGLASPAEIEAFRPAIVETALAHCRETRPLEARETYFKAFLQITNLWVHDPRVRAFVFARRFARVAAELLEVDGVRLYHDQALLKEPGGGYTPWHQDQNFWPLDTDRTLTMWMPLVDVPAEVGSMSFGSGSHRLGNLGDLFISDASHAALSARIRELGLRAETHGALAAGDATFHGGWTLHSAGPNPSRQTREVMTVIYFADGARVGPADHPVRTHDLAAWLRPCRPGDLAAGELNPLLWSRAAG